jgi:hypothetical protein
MIYRSIFGLVAAVWLSLGITGCTKQAFQEAAVKENRSVVYVYRPKGSGGAETTYDLLVNGRAAGTLHPNCYIALEVPKEKVVLTVRNSDRFRAAVETKVVELDGGAGNEYYVRVTQPFEVAVADASSASEEIRKTVLWKDFDLTINMAGDEKEAPAEKAEKPVAGDLKELERLHALKEKGAITAEEYEVLKARVISGE